MLSCFHSLVWGYPCQALLHVIVLLWSRRVLMIRGEPAVGRVSRAATLYSVGSMSDPDHEAAIRFSGEAPRWRAHSGLGFEAMAVFGPPPHRIMISDLCANARRMPKLVLFPLPFDHMVQATAVRSATPT